MPIRPCRDGCPVIMHELPPFSIKRLNNAESMSPACCARHKDDFVRRVLSTVLVETPRVLPIWASCCQ